LAPIIALNSVHLRLFKSKPAAPPRRHPAQDRSVMFLKWNDVETEADAAGSTTAYYRAMKLRGEGIQIINAHITLIDRPQNDYCHLGSRSGAVAYEGCYGVHPLQLGRNVLKKLRIYIATKEKVLYFTPADAAK
jgi:hypothetical protein